VSWIVPDTRSAWKFPGVASVTVPLDVAFTATFEYPDQFGTSSAVRIPK